MGNTTSNVSVGKPKIGGAIYNAPIGTVLPTDAIGALNAAFNCVGYISDAGVTNGNGPSGSQVKAWGGDVVLSLETDKPDTFKFAMIEVLDVNVLKAVYGSENVSGALPTGITVRANNSPHEASAWVIDIVMTNNALKRIVIPNAVISALDDIAYTDSSAVGYAVTLSAMPGDAAFGYDTHKEYIIRNES